MQVVDVVVPHVVGFKVRLYVTELGLNGVDMIHLLIDERNSVINDTVRVTLSVWISVRSPAITDNRSACFEPSTYNGLQGVSGSVRYWNKNCSAKLTFDTAEHPLPLNRVSPIYFRQPNIFSSIQMVLLGPPIFSEQPSLYASIVVLQNKRQYAIVLELKPYFVAIVWLVRGAWCMRGTVHVRPAR